MSLQTGGNPHDDGLLGELEGLLRRGAISKLDEFDSWALVLSECFPFQLNRIDWIKMPGHLLLPASPRLDAEWHEPDRYFARRAPAIRAFVEDISRTHGLGMQATTLFIEDSVGFVLRMTLQTLLDHHHILFSYPQHHYVIPEDASWILN